MVAHAHHRLDEPRNPHLAVQRMYQRAYRQGQLALIWSTLVRRSRHLWGLDEIESTCTIRDRKNIGMQKVPIRQIQGSWGRGGDFDVDFHPLTPNNRERWLSVAIAQMSAALPPVRLVRVGKVSFVLDGHHRISVAQALGQKEIDAWVTVWDVDGPLPWE